MIALATRLRVAVMCRPCPTCGAGSVSRRVDVCGACLGRVPRHLRDAFRIAERLRKGDRDGYRIERARVRRWIGVDNAEKAADQPGRHRPKTETTKETS